MSIQKMVEEFHQRFDCAIDDRSAETVDHRSELLSEEYNELQVELWYMLNETGDLTAIAKEMADVVYVVFGMAVALGIDLEEAVRRVHESNMTKIWPDGLPRSRPDGKILKPPGYYSPDLTDVVKEL